MGLTTAALVVTFLLGVLASMVAQPIWLVLSGTAEGVFSDLPRVNGEWVAEYREPDLSGQVLEAGERVTFHQLGRLVWGRAARSDGDGAPFKYSARLKRNTLLGTFQPVGVGTAVARGAFQVVVADDDGSMSGWCVWKDSDTGKIEASEIRFRRDV